MKKIKLPPEISTLADIQQLASSGFDDWKRYGEVSVDSDGDLLIFNYTPKAQYEARWNFFERVSRGLIVNRATGEIAARPFDKFFNWSEDGRYAAGHIVTVTEKMDGCFRYDTPLQCWDGSTCLIGEVVSKTLRPTLIGMDEQGQLVPCEIIEHFDNGRKDNWLAITVSNPVSKKSGAGGHPNVIRLTSNHHIFINGAFQPAQAARVGDTITTFSMQPSSTVLHVIEAGLLGDGSLTRIHNGYRYQESHSAKHGEYVNALNDWLGECALRERQTLSGYGSQMCWAQSKQYDALSGLRKKWYPKDIKAVPENLNWLDDFAIAKWYMDDGSLGHSAEQENRALFATNSFTKSDVERLALHLQNVYCVNCTIFNHKGWNLRINAGRDKSIDAFWRAITPHIVPCMRYKLPENYHHVEYIQYTKGKQVYVPAEATILAIRKIAPTKKNFPSGRKGFDIRTTTGNYFAKGILVHNSLGILYRSGEYKIATRGAFHSEQAEWATKFLNTHFDLKDLPNELTLLFEIIYPENRVVVDYHGEEKLVLLAARNRVSGDYLPFFPDVYEMGQKYGFPLPKVFTFNNVTDIIRRTGSLSVDEEGYVIEFSDGQRFKIKGDRYLEMHRLIFGLSFKNTLIAVMNDTVNYVRSQLPDEFLKDFNRWVNEIETTIAETKRNAQAAFDAAPKATRKDFAIWVMEKHKPLAPYLFAMFDGKDLMPIIYKMAFQDRPNEKAVKQTESTA